MNSLCQRFLSAVFLAAFLWAPQAHAAGRFDDIPRIAVISAFEPELVLLRDKLEQARKFSANGVEFMTGTLQGKPVVLFLSGISMVNAAMNTQLALDRFDISHIVFSGIAGGVNPSLHIGDVTVVERWGQYLEVLLARETAPGAFDLDKLDDIRFPHFGMLHTRPVKVKSAAQPQIHKKFWFDVDAEMLGIARGLRQVGLSGCDAANKCLSRQPRLVVGGNGVSGPAFLDNAALREHVFTAFHANVVDMESAACAMVAYSNGVPFIAFRSLSDLAGGGEGANEMHTFMNIAANNSAKVLLAFLGAWK